MIFHLCQDLVHQQTGFCPMRCCKCLINLDFWTGKYDLTCLRLLTLDVCFFSMTTYRTVGNMSWSIIYAALLLPGIKTSSNTRSEICTSERKGFKSFSSYLKECSCSHFRGHQDVSEPEKLLVLTDRNSNTIVFCWTSFSSPSLSFKGCSKQEPNTVCAFVRERKRLKYLK